MNTSRRSEAIWDEKKASPGRRKIESRCESRCQPNAKNNIIRKEEIDQPLTWEQ